MDEYLTIKEAAELLKVSPKRVRNLMCEGVLKQDLHFFRPPGLGARFKRSALVAWIEQKKERAPEIIPLKRGSVLRIPSNGLQGSH
jgi:excisionase family DNA binding protein